MAGGSKLGKRKKKKKSRDKLSSFSSPQTNLGVFRDTIELMFEDDDRITKTLINVGVSRSIDILEVASYFFTFCSFLLLPSSPWF